MAKCRRTVCTNEAEGFKHKETGELYCGECAERINEACEQIVIMKDEGNLLAMEHCVGCEDNYYNHTRASTGGCWLRKSGRMALAQCVSIHSMPVQLSNGQYGHRNPLELKPSCFHQRGYVFYRTGNMHFPKVCPLPPSGWKCTREVGHTGPCAASEVECH